MPHSPLRVVFFGTSTFAVPVLEALAKEHRVAAVFTQPDRPAGRGRKLARSRIGILADDLGLLVEQPPRLRRREAVERVANLAADCLVVADYGQILPPAVLEATRLGAVNVHASLLPELRGAAPAVWAVARGFRRTGVSTMQVDAGLDTGPVFLQREVEIEPRESAPELLGRLAPIGASLLLETLEGLEAGTLHPLPQDENRATFAPRISRSDAVLDWQAPAAALGNRVRAFAPATTVLSGKVPTPIRVHEAVATDSPSPLPGHFRNAGSARRPKLLVGAGESSALEIRTLQLPGSRRMTAADSIRGRRLPPEGEFLSKDQATAHLFGEGG